MNEPCRGVFSMVTGISVGIIAGALTMFVFANVNVVIGGVDATPESLIWVEAAIAMAVSIVTTPIAAWRIAESFDAR